MHSARPRWHLSPVPYFFLLVLVATPARADPFGADIPFLSGILVQASQSVLTLGQTLTTLQQSYEEAKRVAGYADEAYRAFQQFQHYNAELFARDVVSSFENAYPDIGYFRREASNAGPWARGSGELQRLLTLCLTGPAGSCGQFQERISFQQTQQALAQTFGQAPQGAWDLAAVDHESAVAMAAGSAQEGRDERARQAAESLINDCASATDGRSLASCQAAGHAAAIQSLALQAGIADQVAAGNRLQALQLQLEAQKRKRELLEATERRAVLMQSVEQATQRPPPLSADGFDLIDGSAQ